ncbi:MAG: GNAT family N-acetyltransferase [Actinomycetota bacterium]|nr:GNAT family N-acetyltransferase [Actinomycetota bacterium]
MRFRAPAQEDAPAVLAVLDARDRADLGVVDSTLEDLLEEWQASEFDLGSNALVVEADGGRIVAYASVHSHGSIAIVPPEDEGQGIGARMLEWVESRERAIGRDHRQWVAASNTRGQELLRAAGYLPVRSYSRMVRELDGTEPAETPAGGFDLRALDVDRDAVALHALDAAAFASAPDYREESLTAFTEEHLHGESVDPELSLVAHRGEHIAGFLLARRGRDEGMYFVDLLAVHPDHQRRGLGSAILRMAFARFAAAGLREAHLQVASDNPRALSIYERAGMSIRWRFDVYERPARARPAARR